MTLKEDLGFLYRDMVQQKMWCDRLAQSEADAEKKIYIKGEAYTYATVAYRVGRMVSEHFKGGSKTVDEWELEAREYFKRNVDGY